MLSEWARNDTGFNQLKINAGAADDSEPEVSHQRRDHRNDDNQLPNRPPTRNPGNKQRHQWPVSQEPTPEEHRPVVQP